MERELLRCCQCDGKVTFTKAFLMVIKVIFDQHVNCLERYCKGRISNTFTKHKWLSFQNMKVIKGLVSHI